MRISRKAFSTSVFKAIIEAYKNEPILHVDFEESVGTNVPLLHLNAWEFLPGIVSLFSDCEPDFVKGIPLCDDEEQKFQLC